MGKTFLEIRNKLELAEYFGISVRQLDFNTYNVEGRYYEFFINKKNGKKRKILAPILSLKQIQKIISNTLLSYYQPKIHVHSYIKNKSIKSNAKIHVNQRFVFNLDLSNFFPSINFGRVRGMFKSPPFSFNDQIATMLAQLCCQYNELPQGSPSSPIISNFICRSLDNQLKYLSKKNKCYYTRYADDITFSTNLFKFPKSIASIVEDNIIVSEELNNIVTINGFIINDEKLCLRRKFEHQYVTGLTVNKKVNVKRRFIRQVRAMLHAWEVYGLNNAAIEHYKKYSVRHKNKEDQNLFINIIEGKLLFISHIRGKDDKIFKSLLKKFQNLSPNQNLNKYLSYQGEKIQIFTEGNTDWMHLKSALDSLSNRNAHNKSLKSAIRIEKYDQNKSIGDTKLKQFLGGYLAAGNKRPIIGIFDSDNINQLGDFVPKNKDGKYRNFDDRVFIFYLPQPTHRKTNKNCIEHFYKDEDLTIRDEFNRRIYLSNEFNSHNGELKTDPSIRCFASRNKLEKTEAVIDSAVRNNLEESLALSKKDFATNIMYKSEKFKNVDFRSFRLIFDIIRDIIKEIEGNS